MKAKTPLGRLSLWFFAAFVLLMLLFFGAVSVGERGGDDLFDNLRLTVPVLSAAAAAVAGAVTGILAMVRQHERSIMVAGVTLVGGFVFAFAVAEVAFPH
ncbi:MAG: hypothetical protein GY745_20100 [Actinomycetia bacterium]|nr:hypothetical protein [Actinomycetes bacterium]MCP3911310.1 hypothetical protein [Actinomycetes bacterium]MCP4087325.1 hypothetical protein [Actinomycetes bacterium]